MAQLFPSDPDPGRALPTAAAGRPRPGAVDARRQRGHRRAAMRRHSAQAGRPRPWVVLSSPVPSERILTPHEREQALQRATRALVATIRSCPAPGIAPFSRRERLAIAAFVGLEALLVVTFSLLARGH